jgi:transposase
MAAQFVIQYRKRGKNDANDAEAICEAVGRPNMRFVAIKSEEQQSTAGAAREAPTAARPRSIRIARCDVLIDALAGCRSVFVEQPITIGSE